jgi:hypothetical protein
MSTNNDLEKIKDALAGIKPAEVKCDDTTMSTPASSSDDMMTFNTADLDFSKLTIGNGGVGYGSGTVTVNGAQGSSGSFLYSAAGLNGSSWGTVTTGPTPSLTVSGDADFEGDIKWKGRSLGTLLQGIEDRLAILQEPDPKKLEKHAALKKAYEHYKTLERLIGDD